jgi:hypothetical protein
MTIKTLRSASFLAVPLILMCGVAAHADQWDKHTKITIDETIEVPGAVLPAGTYIFRLIDSPSDRHIVQVSNENEDHVFATVLAIPNYRLEPTGKTVLSFYEVPAGNPIPVHAWFYPGDNFGQEFVYPADRTFKVSENRSTTATVIGNPVVAVETPEPLVATVETAAVEPAIVPVVDETPVAPATEVALNEPPVMPGTPVMPETATNFPLLALAGLILIGGALSLGTFAKRMG